MEYKQGGKEKCGHLIRGEERLGDIDYMSKKWKD